MERGGTFPKHTGLVDQLQPTAPADQSEHIALSRRRGFIETGSKQNISDRLGREEPQQRRICRK